jgi:hypothetical protein
MNRLILPLMLCTRLELAAEVAGVRVAVEGLMFAAGTALYVPGPWSPPPPSENVVAIVGIIALAILAPWAYWIDRHRPSAS